jgi:hypothetical protein
VDELVNVDNFSLLIGLFRKGHHMK